MNTNQPECLLEESGQSGYPWSFYSFLGHRHTIPADAFAAVSGGVLSYALLQSQPDNDVGIDLPSLKDAREAALISAREILADSVKSGAKNSPEAVTITDESFEWVIR